MVKDPLHQQIELSLKDHLSSISTAWDVQVAVFPELFTEEQRRGQWLKGRVILAAPPDLPRPTVFVIASSSNLAAISFERFLAVLAHEAGHVEQFELGLEPFEFDAWARGIKWATAWRVLPQYLLNVDRLVERISRLPRPMEPRYGLYEEPPGSAEALYIAKEIQRRIREGL